jgi:hypothetical protein
MGDLTGRTERNQRALPQREKEAIQRYPCKLYPLSPGTPGTLAKKTFHTPVESETGGNPVLTIFRSVPNRGARPVYTHSLR